jgi:2,3-bisphosphoglycerate-independent phosphoglycerate mutase
VVLLVLDGWGIGPNNPGNAIARANTPNMDSYWTNFPHAQIGASGEAVGLPRGEDGNTLTGHLNIGAGSIIYQDLPRINMAIADGSFARTPAFQRAFQHVQQQGSTLHLMGLIGAGGVHSNIEHLYALLEACKQANLQQVMIHGFTDGRDSPPTSGIEYVQHVIDRTQELGVGQLASLTGRYYAMDRDKRWERIEKTYDALTLGTGIHTQDPVAALQAQYDAGTTDEFVEPINVVNPDGSPRVIGDNDAVIFFNYRIDRPRELTKAFVERDFEAGTKHEWDPYSIKYDGSHLQEEEEESAQTFQRQRVLQNLYFVTMTRYEEGLPVDVAFPPQNIKDPLGKVLSDHGLRQLRMAETEKQKFVTYYMNGQSEQMFPGEKRVIYPSKGAKSYDDVPEMSAYEITAGMIDLLEADEADVVICNLANADMVGHTGNLEATIQACEILDDCISQIVNTVYARDGIVMITADHGNAEELINNRTGERDTEHSIYPVPLMIISPQFENNPVTLPSGILADVAPTMLKLMGIEKPRSMSGRALV